MKSQKLPQVPSRYDFHSSKPYVPYGVPHKVHHFLTGKTTIMIILFFITIGIALASYVYLMNKVHQHVPIAKSQLPPTPAKGQATMAKPTEYTDGALAFFYPGSMVSGTASATTIMWSTQTQDGTIIPETMSVTKQNIPFTDPKDGDNNHTSPYFAIDDYQNRNINGLLVKEYTVHCGIFCYYRIDQLQIGSIYYQLYFDTSRSGFSDQTEKILATLRDKTTQPKGDNQVACTQEAKLCSDGSYVSRQGPKCEFAACPSN